MWEGDWSSSYKMRKKKNYECFQCEENHWPLSQETYLCNKSRVELPMVGSKVKWREEKHGKHMIV